MTEIKYIQFFLIFMFVQHCWLLSEIRISIIAFVFTGLSPIEISDLNPPGLNPSNREARKDVPCENTDVGVKTSSNKISIFICSLTSTLNGKMTTEPKYSNLRFVLTSHYASLHINGINYVSPEKYWGGFIWEYRNINWEHKIQFYPFKY